MRESRLGGILSVSASRENQIGYIVVEGERNVNWVSVNDALPTIREELQQEGYIQVKVAVWRGLDWTEAWYEPRKSAFFDAPGWFGQEVTGVTHWARVEGPEDIRGTTKGEVEFGRIMTIGGRLHFFWSSNFDGKLDKSKVLSEDRDEAAREVKEMLASLRSMTIQ